MSGFCKKKILINCSNLHAGGGVAVATSFIDCLSKMGVEHFDVCLLLSSSVSQNLRLLNTDISVFYRCDVIDYFGLAAFWSGLDRYFQEVDLVFTVFGPAYFLFSRTIHVVGFAQPNIIYPKNPISMRLNLFQRLKTRLKYKVQECFFSRADLLVVELEHVKAGLEKLRLFKNKNIEIVYSAVHAVFNDPSSWSDLYVPSSSASLKFGIISRNYPHKNLNILPDVKRCLYEIYGLSVDFYVTFQPDEWDDCERRFKAEVINVGGLSLSQCPTFYYSLDGVIFPSLLECFSAVPIEAMMLKKPLFASDLPFIRDVCGEHCNYFNPLDAKDIARSIYEYYKLPAGQKESGIDSAYIFVQRYPGPDKRAEKYLSLMNDLLLGDGLNCKG